MPEFASLVLGGTTGDSGIYLWLVEVVFTALTPSTWFNLPAFYPYEGSLAWSDNFILPALLVAPLRALGVSLAGCFNTLLIVALVLTGWCGWRLTYFLTKSRAPAYFVATAYISCHYFTEHLGHPQLQFAFWLPLTIEYTFRTLAKFPRSSLSSLFWSGVLGGLLLAGAFFTTLYYAVFAGLIMPFLVIWAICFSRKHRRPRKLIVCVAGGMLPLLCIIPFVLPYLQTEAVFGSRSLYEAYYFSAHLLSYISTNPHHLLLGSTSALSHSEAHLSIGFISPIILIFLGFKALAPLKTRWLVLAIILLTIGALAGNIHGLAGGQRILKLASASSAVIALALATWWVARYSSGQWIGALLTMALIATLLSLGPLGNETKGEYSFGLFTAGYHIIPGLSGIRAVSRFGIIVLLILPLVAGIILNDGLLRFGKTKWLVWIAACFGLTLENATLNYGVEAIANSPIVLAALPPPATKPGAILILPMSEPVDESGQVVSWSDFAVRNTLAMQYAHSVGRSTVNGYSGLRTKLMRDLPRRTRGFPDERSCVAIQELVDLRFVLYGPNKNIPSLIPSCLEIVKRDESGYILFAVKPEIKLTGSALAITPASSAGFIIDTRGCSSVTVSKTSADKLEGTTHLLISEGKRRVVCEGLHIQGVIPNYWRITNDSDEKCYVVLSLIKRDFLPTPLTSALPGELPCYFEQPQQRSPF